MEEKITYLFITTLILTLVSCSPIRVITSKYHESEIQTVESINKFIKKRRINDYPVLRYDTSFNDFGKIYFNLAMFNKEGKFISLGFNDKNCKDKKYLYTVLTYILEKGDHNFIEDSLQLTYYEQINNNNYFNDPNKLNRLSKNEFNISDTLLWKQKTESISMNLNNYTSYIRTLEGQFIDIEPLWSDYIILQEFVVSGEQNLTGIWIRRLIRDVQKVNKKFGNRVQIILINGDKMT